MTKPTKPLTLGPQGRNVGLATKLRCRTQLVAGQRAIHIARELGVSNRAVLPYLHFRGGRLHSTSTPLVSPHSREHLRHLRHLGRVLRWGLAGEKTGLGASAMEEIRRTSANDVSGRLLLRASMLDARPQIVNERPSTARAIR